MMEETLYLLVSKIERKIMEYSNTNYFFDVIGFIIPILALIYWTRKEPDGIWIFLKEIHENNLKDYEMDKELEEQENS